MSNSTGRLSNGLDSRVVSIIFGATADDDIDDELPLIIKVDQAHLLMLAERGIVSRADVKTLLKEINHLQNSNFAPLRGQVAQRGLYLLYEQHLIKQLGEHIGGVVHTARSRNDLGATVMRLKLREPYEYFLHEFLRLRVALLRMANRYRDIVMPAYTHGQPAIAITYGYYLLGVEYALALDTRDFDCVSDDLDRCPLGAGAVAGTDWPINPQRTAELLGFRTPVHHSMEAVASRDLVLRLLSAAMIVGTTLSRLCTDLHLWLTQEFNFLRLPERLVGSSSMMPQKANPFILEHIKGKCASPLGAVVAAGTAMHNTPFTNSIEVKTEAVSHLWRALQDITDAVKLTRLIVEGALPQTEPMEQRAAEGYTSATALANLLVKEDDISFRTAHREVGTVVRHALENEQALDEAATALLGDRFPSLRANSLTPKAVAAAAEYGGGPGESSFSNILSAAKCRLFQDIANFRARRRFYADAELRLRKEVGSYLS